MADASINATRDYEPVFGDYVALLKPRVMSLVVFTALVGLLVAPVSLHPFEAFAAIWSGLFASSSSSSRCLRWFFDLLLLLLLLLDDDDGRF